MIPNSGRPVRVGLSGGIAAGKSTVAERFAFLGARVLDADAVSRTALDPGTECYDAVVAHFGGGILKEDGTVDRKKLGSIVFGDEPERLFLNSIVHPYVLNKMEQSYEEISRQGDCRVVVFDIPLLIECGAYLSMQKNIIVASDDEIRIERIMKRNLLSREDAVARIRSQIPQEEQICYADYVIWNNSTVADLNAAVDNVFKRLMGECS